MVCAKLFVATPYLLPPRSTDSRSPLLLSRAALRRLDRQRLLSTGSATPQRSERSDRCLRLQRRPVAGASSTEASYGDSAGTDRMIVTCARSSYSSGVKATDHSERPSCHFLHLASKVLKLAPNSASTRPLSATLACRLALSKPCILTASMIRYGRQSRRSQDASHGISQKPWILINGQVSRFEPRIRDHNNGHLGSLFVINKAEKATRDLYKKSRR